MEWKRYKERMHVYFPISREGKLLHVGGGARSQQTRRWKPQKQLYGKIELYNGRITDLMRTVMEIRRDQGKESREVKWHGSRR